MALFFMGVGVLIVAVGLYLAWKIAGPLAASAVALSCFGVTILFEALTHG